MIRRSEVLGSIDWSKVLIDSLRSRQEKLCRENCYNPLLAVLSNEYPAEDAVAKKMWMDTADMVEIDEAEHPLTSESAVKIGRFLNTILNDVFSPMTKLLFEKGFSPSIHLAFAYYFNEFSDILTAYNIKIIDFLENRNLFESTRWIYDEKGINALDIPIVPIIYKHISSLLIPEDEVSFFISCGWQPVDTITASLIYRPQETSSQYFPSTIIHHWLKGLDTIDTKSITGLEMQNPWQQMLTGKPFDIKKMEKCFHNVYFREELNKANDAWVIRTSSSEDLHFFKNTAEVVSKFSKTMDGIRKTAREMFGKLQYEEFFTKRTIGGRRGYHISEDIVNRLQQRFRDTK